MHTWIEYAALISLVAVVSAILLFAAFLLGVSTQEVAEQSEKDDRDEKSSIWRLNFSGCMNCSLVESELYTSP